MKSTSLEVSSCHAFAPAIARGSLDLRSFWSRWEVQWTADVEDVALVSFGGVDGGGSRGGVRRVIRGSQQ